METQLHLDILPQPDDFTCGPTSLHAVYRYFGDGISLGQVIDETSRLENGGTMAVLLACHALRRGYRATIYSYNLQLFDPTWFTAPGTDIRGKLEAQARTKTGARVEAATEAYLEYLDRGGEMRFQDLTTGLIRRYQNRGVPILTGLSSTYLYGCAREFGPKDDYDDVRGEPAGHFVVLCGYDKDSRNVWVADPLHPNPVSEAQHYNVNIDRLVCAILLGVLTYDANLLIIQPAVKGPHPHHANADRR